MEEGELQRKTAALAKAAKGTGAGESGADEASFLEVDGQVKPR